MESDLNFLFLEKLHAFEIMTWMLRGQSGYTFFGVDLTPVFASGLIPRTISRKIFAM